jgi:hypothetical protein
MGAAMKTRVIQDDPDDSPPADVDAPRHADVEAPRAAETRRPARRDDATASDQVAEPSG